MKSNPSRAIVIAEQVEIVRRLWFLQRSGKLIAWVNASTVRVLERPAAVEHWDFGNYVSWGEAAKMVGLGGKEVAGTKGR